MMRKDRDRFNLLCDIGDLAALLAESPDIENFFQSAIKMVSRYLNAEACSIYLYDEKLKKLVLKAAIGLNSDAVGKIRIKPGEGLVGETFAELRATRESSVRLNPKFKYSEEAGDERFESFLAVPVQRGRQLGVLVVQHEKRDYFSQIDVVVLRALSSQIAGVFEKALLPQDAHKTGAKLAKLSDADIFKSLQVVKGESASGGYAFGAATVFKRSHNLLITEEFDSDDAYSLEDFYKAVQKTSDQLIGFQNQLADQLLESASLVFDAHFMILKDAKFINKIVRRITEGTPPPKAVIDVAGHYIEIFSSSSNEYIQEKVMDMEDLAARLLRNLCNWSSEELELSKSRIVIARDLYPSEILKLASEDVMGIILVRGGVMSHVSILSRSLKIPMVIADQPEMLCLPEATPVLMDADKGNIYVYPKEQLIREFKERKKTQEDLPPVLPEMSPTTLTRDGIRVHLLANINLLSELAISRNLKAEGIGLYRTEFPFLIRSKFPSEAEQYLIYRRLFDEMPSQEITIRTLDLGGDKMPVCSNSALGEDLELGLRSIRFSLKHRDIFEQQIRAILRAASEIGPVRIMFPMISSLDEFQEAKQVVLDCIAYLKQKDLPHHPGPAIGMMVELPSVLGIIQELVREADFLSIGTNDFIQYMLAVDRSNEKVADYYQPYHPSVLRGLAKVVRAATVENKDISICGEMAHELEYIPFILGIGVRRISVDPQFLPVLQKKIVHLNLSDAEEHAKELLSKSTLKDAYEVLQRQGKK